MANIPDDSKSYFSQEVLPAPPPPGINIVPTPTGSQVEDGSLRSSNYRKGSSGWSINSDGTAEFIGLEAINIITTQSFPVSETMSAGTPVGIDWEGKIAKAMRSFPDDATNQFTDLAALWGVFPITRNNFVVVYATTVSATFRIRAVVATADSSTNNITFGTSTIVASYGGEGYRDGDVCQVDTNTFVAVYSDATGSENNYGVAFTVSGTTITAGSQKTLSVTDNLDELRCCKSDTLTFFWCGYRDTFGDWEMGTATVSGTTITTEYSSGSSIANIVVASMDIKLAQVATDKIAMLQGSNGYIAIITTSGSITAGTAVDLFDTTGGKDSCSFVSLADDTFYCQLGTKVGYFTVSGTVPSLSGSIVTRTGSEGGLVEHNNLIYDFQSGPTDEENAGLWSVVYSGGALTLTQLNASLKKTGITSVAIASDGYKIFALCPGDLSYWLSSMSYNFVGFLQDGATTTSGQSGRVIVRGIDSNQSGLVAGSYYLVSNGALTRLSPVETVNTLDDVVNVVKAISSTQILV